MNNLRLVGLFLLCYIAISAIVILIGFQTTITMMVAVVATLYIKRVWK